MGWGWVGAGRGSQVSGVSRDAPARGCPHFSLQTLCVARAAGRVGRKGVLVWDVSHPLLKKEPVSHMTSGATEEAVGLLR